MTEIKSYIKGLSVQVINEKCISNANIELEGVTIIAGSNCTGKSTLIKLIANTLTPQSKILNLNQPQQLSNTGLTDWMLIPEGMSENLHHKFGEILTTQYNEPVVVLIDCGMKPFVLLFELLAYHQLDGNTILIIDQLENGLSPDWQCKLAEILVLVSKQYKTLVLVTTQSPYVVDAMEVYSEQNQIHNSMRYYLGERKEYGSEFRNVTTDTNPIFKIFARPFQDLENERYGDED